MVKNSKFSINFCERSVRYMGLGVLLVVLLGHSVGSLAEVDRRLKREIENETGNLETSLSIENDQIEIRDLGPGQPRDGDVFGASVYKDRQNTVVEDAPLLDSRVDRMRKSRQRMEVANEQKLVEKLEESRSDDEKARIDRLFKAKESAGPEHRGHQRFGTSPSPFGRTPQLRVNSDEPVPGRIETPIEEPPEQALNKEKRDYFSGLFGVTEYGGARNIENDIAIGAAFGREMDNKITVEGSFIYSSQNIRETSLFGYGRRYGGFGAGVPMFRELEQYNFSVSGVYNFFEGNIRPHAGGLAGYTYRKYSPKRFADRRVNKEVTTDSIDVGLVVGLDLLVSERLSLGADYRWLTNVANNNESDFYSAYNQYYAYSAYSGNGGDPVEEVDYTMLSLALKYRF